MVTNYPHPITSIHDGLAPESSEMQVDGLSARVMDRVRQMFCGLHGHDPLLHFEHDRMSLRCASCGHETPGWELNETPPTVTIRGDARRHMLRPQLISARRIA
jgi:hypothetical protein